MQRKGLQVTPVHSWPMHGIIGLGLKNTKLTVNYTFVDKWTIALTTKQVVFLVNGFGVQVGGVQFEPSPVNRIRPVFS